MAAKVDVYEIVTNQILDALEKDIVPWAKPWNSKLHRNIANKYVYRGINQLLCELYMMEHPEYKEPEWLTYKGAKKLKGNVKQGEKGHIIVFWNFIENKKAEPDKNGDLPKIPLLRYYKVFNIAQCENLEIPVVEDEDNTEEVVLHVEAEDIVKGYENPPTLTEGGTMAYYSPPADKVNLPLKDDFKNTNGYYATLFHELIHSTGHTDRLNRSELMDKKQWGDTEYSKEELTAELGACMLCATADIEPNIQNSASYIAGWRKKLGEDKKLIISASSRAKKAVEHIIGNEE